MESPLITLRCLNCGKDLDLTSEVVGPSLLCPECGHVMAIAQGGREAVPSATLIVNQGSNPTSPTGSGGAPDNPDFVLHLTQQAAGAGFTGHPAGGSTDSLGGQSLADLTDFLAPPQAPDELGRLGSYRVLRVLGAGGMGVVYEAEDTALQRRVALKAMLPSLTVTASARQRFLREARTAAAVEHEHIVAIFQVGEERNIPFLAMPLLKGESLEDRLTREDRLPLAEVLRIGRETAEALAAAHERGMIHRDVKPANVFLEGERAKVKLLDFGLARAIQDEGQLTGQGGIVGTPAYMAPEQAMGASTDARSDLFSLGCVIYRMCSGELAFKGPSAVSILLAVANKHPASPREVSAAVPAPLSDLIMQMLAKRPVNRPASARAVIAALDGIGGVAAPEPPHAAPPPALPKPPSRHPRRKVPAGFLAAAIVVTASAILGAWILNRPAAAPVEIGIAYGTEKEAWFKDALKAFADTEEGKNIKVNLLPMGSVEGGEAVWKTEDQRIHVWSPASSLYRDGFVAGWQSKHAGQNPILQEESLALTPLVFVLWKDRQDAFLARYKTVSFATIAQAIEEKQGWAAVAGRPDWGRFKFGQTNPEQSNSGLMSLVLLAYDASDKDRDLTVADLARPEFRARLRTIERGLAGTSHSTGTLMKEMVGKGPSAFDALLVYENVVIDYLKAARGRWGELKVSYPRRNLWSDNPYYILDVPWSSTEQREAASALLRFLMSEPVQKQALKHGFRPGNVDIPIRDVPDSPFVVYKDAGLSEDLGVICKTPDNRIVQELLGLWREVR
jgi:serine/threonine protein kinase/ABC-type Fe3+ transport system substrate-binding protein